jgi:hypothetical protein
MMLHTRKCSLQQRLAWLHRRQVPEAPVAPRAAQFRPRQKLGWKGRLKAALNNLRLLMKAPAQYLHQLEAHGHDHCDGR